MNKVTFVMEIYCLRLNIEWFLDSLKIEYKMHTQDFWIIFWYHSITKDTTYSKSEQVITLVLVYCISTKICFEEEKKKKIILTYIDFFGFGFDRRFLFFFRFIWINPFFHQKRPWFGLICQFVILLRNLIPTIRLLLISCSWIISIELFNQWF